MNKAIIPMKKSKHISLKGIDVNKKTITGSTFNCRVHINQIYKKRYKRIIKRRNKDICEFNTLQIKKAKEGKEEQIMLIYQKEQID